MGKIGSIKKKIKPKVKKEVTVIGHTRITKKGDVQQVDTHQKTMDVSIEQDDLKVKRKQQTGPLKKGKGKKTGLSKEEVQQKTFQDVDISKIPDNLKSTYLSMQSEKTMDRVNAVEQLDELGLELAMKDSESIVRDKIPSNRNATQDQIMRLRQDSDLMVRREAFSNIKNREVLKQPYWVDGKKFNSIREENNMQLNNVYLKRFPEEVLSLRNSGEMDINDRKLASVITPEDAMKPLTTKGGKKLKNIFEHPDELVIIEAAKNRRLGSMIHRINSDIKPKDEGYDMIGKLELKDAKYKNMDPKHLAEAIQKEPLSFFREVMAKRMSEQGRIDLIKSTDNPLVKKSLLDQISNRTSKQLSEGEFKNDPLIQRRDAYRKLENTNGLETDQQLQDHFTKNFPNVTKLNSETAGRLQNEDDHQVLKWASENGGDFDEPMSKIEWKIEGWHKKAINDFNDPKKAMEKAMEYSGSDADNLQKIIDKAAPKFTQEYVQNGWLESSNGHGAALLKMQAGGKIHKHQRKFDSTSTLSHEQIQEKWNQLSSKQKQNLDRGYQVSKSLTQVVLNKAFPNQDSIKLYRGTSMKEVVGSGNNISAQSNPLSSWTEKPKIAGNFAKFNAGGDEKNPNVAIMSADIPKKDIFLSNIFGAMFKTFSNGEYVLEAKNKLRKIKAEYTGPSEDVPENMYEDEQW